MTLAPGSRLGPYEIVSPLGSGGMGEVYRGRDPRLGREVAIKVLPASFSQDPDRLRRFEQEARAAGILNHPNITAVYDIGTCEGAPYVVQELLEGETLRHVLAGGRVSSRRAVDYALQIASGLSAAHQKGIIHRDLKPENLFVTKGGRVKILDFGLAKLTHTSAQGEATSAPTAELGTEPGITMGTPSYMSPEQVRGEPVDHRSDIFSLGTILYEMLSGERPFGGASSVETMNAILKEDPPDLSSTRPTTSPTLERIVRHCLEKNPEERFQSAGDITFDLECVSEVSVSGVSRAVRVASRGWFRLSLYVLGLVAVAVVALIVGRKTAVHPMPFFHRITFRLGNVSSARFAPDGQAIIYAAAWEGNQTGQLFETRSQSPESLRLPLPDAELASISRSGEMALLLGLSFSTVVRSGTLASVPISGGAPRELVKDVQDADWTPDGRGLALARVSAGRYQLEFPSGRVLYKTAGWISHLRVAPAGDEVAFLDHPISNDDAGSVAIIDRRGNKTTLSGGWLSEQGLAWSASGKEIWFSAKRTEGSRAVYAVNLSGRLRLITRTPANLTLQDISRDGRILLTQMTWRRSMIGSFGDSRDREIPALGGAFRPILSDDGKILLYTEEEEAGGPGYSAYLSRLDGTPAIRLGEGDAWAFSPDSGWVLAVAKRRTPAQLMMLPTGAGEVRQLTDDVINHQEANFLPDGKRVLFVGNEPGRAARVYIQDLSGGKPHPVTPEGVVGTLPTVDGKFIAARDPELSYRLYSVEDGHSQPIRGLNPHEYPMRWSLDGRYLYIRPFPQGLPVHILRLDSWTGQRDTWKDLAPSDPSGVAGLGRIALTPDGRNYVYQYDRFLSDLYVVEGLR